MDFGLDDEDRALLGTVRRLLSRRSTVAHVREAEAATGVSLPLWAELVEAGLVAMAVPDDDGPDGTGPDDDGTGDDADGPGARAEQLAMVAEELGRRLAPVPWVESVVALRLLARCGVEPSDELFALAPVDLRAGYDVLVPAAASAAGGVVGRLDDAVVLVTSRSPGGWPRNASFGDGNLARVDPARAAQVQVLASGAGAAALWARAEDERRVLAAARLIGVGRGALELGVGYAVERAQFGGPIGRFQAVAHPLADAATDLEATALLVREAAWALDDDPEQARLLSLLAFPLAAEAAMDAAAHALHVHGGYGLTSEYDVQLFHRRALAWALVGGDPQNAWEQAADLAGAWTGDGS